MTKERVLIRDLVLLLEGVINPGILRFCGEAQALTKAKQYLADQPATGNSGLEKMNEEIDDLKIDLRVAIDRQAKLNNEIHNRITKMHNDSDNLAERLSDLEEATDSRSKPQTQRPIDDPSPQKP